MSDDQERAPRVVVVAVLVVAVAVVAGVAAEKRCAVK